MEGKLIVLSGPSGVGKGTICQKLDREGLDLNTSISMTTREIRNNEKEGVNYYYTTDEEFNKKVEEGYFLEHASYESGQYGTPRHAVECWLKDGHNVLLEIETNGAGQIIHNFPKAVSIFILPPSKEELERRLRERNTETEEQIQGRLKKAFEELEKADMYQYQVVNNDLDVCIQDVTNIIKKETGKE